MFECLTFCDGFLVPFYDNQMKEAQSDHCLEIDDDCIVVNPPVPVCTATVPVSVGFCLNQTQTFIF